MYYETFQYTQQKGQNSLPATLTSPSFQFSSVTQSCPTLCDLTQGLQHTKLPCPSPTSRACSNYPLSQWCHPTISSSVVPFSRLLSSPASVSFLMSQFLSSFNNYQLRANAISTLLSPISSLTYLPILGLMLGLEEGNGNPLQFSCLENPMDRGPW